LIILKHILCYGDSNTFGAIPKAAGDTSAYFRYDVDVRWPCLLGQELGEEYRVIEEGLNGRTTCFDDPTCEARNGLPLFYPTLISHQPLDLVVIMLGTNDTKGMYSASPEDIGRGMERLLKVALNPFTYIDGAVPKVLLVSPIRVGDGVAGSHLRGIFDEGSIRRADALPDVYREIAKNYGVSFLNAVNYAEPSPLDCIHLDTEGHKRLAYAMAIKIRDIFAAS
jgi:lysophospholipase L1-like esterase